MGTPHSDVLARLIVEHVQDGIVVTDAQGVIEWVNPAFAAMSGYELEDVLGLFPIQVLSGPDTTRESKEMLVRAIEDRTACETDALIRTKTGDTAIWAVRISPILSDDGTVANFAATLRDVTRERHHAQDSTDFRAYRRALEIQAIVSVTDVRGKITYVNQKFCKISGYEREELLGQTHRIVNSGHHDRKFFKEMWRAIRMGDTWHGEVCNRTKSGEIYWVDTTVVPVHGRRGEIERYVSIRYDVTDRKIAENKLIQQVETDPLTGVGNRERFVADLKDACLRRPATSDETEFLVLMIDLDHFKDLNDRLGHHMGDVLLCEVARRLQEIVAGEGSVSRMGGDEFAALIMRKPGADDESIVRSLHSLVSEATSLDGVVYFPSVSIGAARYPQDASTSEGLMVNADMALYDAKRAGRRTWSFFDPTTRVHVDHRNRIREIVETAIDAASFDVALQPVCSTRTRGHKGFEVLARLSHEGENVPADHFIPIAEQYGLMPAVGRLIIEKAIAAYAGMRDAGLAPGKLGMNFAAPQFREPGFVETVQDVLLHHGVSPEDLIVEITETALIGRSISVVADALSRLRGIGASIALDDFGTGFSSLSHLRDFPVDMIKIDSSFVKSIDTSAEDRKLVRGLVDLARNLELVVVAEGVETEVQARVVEELGCEYMQGYVHSRPLTVEAATRFLRTIHSVAGKMRASA